MIPFSFFQEVGCAIKQILKVISKYSINLRADHLHNFLSFLRWFRLSFLSGRSLLKSKLKREIPLQLCSASISMPESEEFGVAWESEGTAPSYPSTSSWAPRPSASWPWRRTACKLCFRTLWTLWAVADYFRAFPGEWCLCRASEFFSSRLIPLY